MNAIHILPKRLRHFLRHLGCNSPKAADFYDFKKFLTQRHRELKGAEFFFSETALREAQTIINPLNPFNPTPKLCVLCASLR